MTKHHATSAIEACEQLNEADPLGTISNGSYWPNLPSDDTASFIIADNYRRPMLRGRRASESRSYRAIRSAAAARVRLGLGVVLAVLTIASTATAAPHSPPASPATIAPGGNITAIVNDTAQYGWPHTTTRPEMIAVTDLALWYGVKLGNRRERVSVACYFGQTIARAHCGIAFYKGKRRTAAFRVNFRAWEDGSYRFTRKAR